MEDSVIRARLLLFFVRMEREYCASGVVRLCAERSWDIYTIVRSTYRIIFAKKGGLYRSIRVTDFNNEILRGVLFPTRNNTMNKPRAFILVGRDYTKI